MKNKIPGKTIDDMVNQFRNYEGEQQSLRSLRFWQLRGWPLRYLADEQVSISPSPPFINIHMSVDWTQSEEDNTLRGMQRYAEKHVITSISGKLIRNDIKRLAGVNAVDLEYTSPEGVHIRKLVFIRYCSEYVITIGAANSPNFTQMVPAIEAFLETLSIHKPDLQLKQALGGRVMIGIPEGWNQVEDTTDNTVWKDGAPSAKTRLGLRLVKVAQDADLTPNMFAGLEDSLFKKELTTISRYLAETGIYILGCALSQTKPVWEDKITLTQEKRNLYTFGIRLATGLHLLLEFEHMGSDKDIFPGGLYWDPFAMELIATIEEKTTT